MAAREPNDRHSDLGPSGKDRQPEPGDDVLPGTYVGTPGKDSIGVQPGTGQEGRSWHSREPDPDDPDDKLNQALKDSFPASDPPQPAQPGVTGWDVSDEAAEKAGRKR